MQSSTEVLNQRHSSTLIHPSSVVSPHAKIGKDVVIGPFCRVYDNVVLGDGCILDAHVVIGGPTSDVRIGKNNRFFAFCAIGGDPQDLHYKGEPNRVVIGDNNVLREYVTVNIGTTKGGGETRLGDSNLIMAYCHIAHDNILGNHVVMANQTQLAGHVHIDDFVTLGGLCALNQFVRIGKRAFIAGAAMINKDVLPFSIAQGNYATVRATNKIGLERSGHSENTITNINRAIRILTKGGTTLEESLARIEKECEPLPEIREMVQFVKSSKRGLALG